MTDGRVIHQSRHRHRCHRHFLSVGLSVSLSVCPTIHCLPRRPFLVAADRVTAAGLQCQRRANLLRLTIIYDMRRNKLAGTGRKPISSIIQYVAVTHGFDSRLGGGVTA